MAESKDTKSGTNAKGNGAGKVKPTAAKAKPSGGTGTRTRSAPRAPTLEAQLNDFFAGVSTLAMVAGDEFSATIIAERAPALAAAWSKLAKRNARVRALIETIVSGSEWGEVAMVTMSVVVPIGAHYGLFPQMMAYPFLAGSGVVPPTPESPEQAEERARRNADN